VIGTEVKRSGVPVALQDEWPEACIGPPAFDGYAGVGRGHRGTVRTFVVFMPLAFDRALPLRVRPADLGRSGRRAVFPHVRRQMQMPD